MALAHFRMLIHELLNKDPEIFPEESPLIVLDSKSAMCMAKNGKDTKYTRHIARRMHLVRNREKYKMHKIDWCEGGLQLADIGTKNVSSEYYNHCISTLMGCICNRSLSLSAFKAAYVLLIGSFCSSNPPPILIYSRVPWCSHKPMNGVWKHLTPPLFHQYILLISFHANYRQKYSSEGIPYQRNLQ